MFVRKLCGGRDERLGLQIDQKLGFIHSFAHKTGLFQVCIMGFKDNPSLSASLFLFRNSTYEVF